MKKVLLLASLVLVLTAALAAGTVVPAVSQPPAQRTTLTFFDPNATDFEKEVNLGGKGFGPGDMGLVKDTVFDAETCEKAGTVLIRFQVVKLAGRNDAFFLDDGSLLLPDGKLTLYLAGKFTEFESEEGFDGAVTGGTAAYRDARGEFHIKEDQEMCDKRGALITLDLAL